MAYAFLQFKNQTEQGSLILLLYSKSKQSFIIYHLGNLLHIAWYVNQLTSRQLHVLGISGPYSLPPTPSFWTAAAEAQTVIHFLFWVIIIAMFFAALMSFLELWDIVK